MTAFRLSSLPLRADVLYEWSLIGGTDNFFHPAESKRMASIALSPQLGFIKKNIPLKKSDFKNQLK